MKLENKVAIVTGASRGIGKALCLGFAEEGSDVVVVARSEVEDPHLPGTIYHTAQEVESLGRRALPVKCDITAEDEVKRMVQRALDEMGRIDILVNNASVASFKPFMDTPTDWLERVVTLNILGMLLCTKHVLPHMIEQRSGSIVNITSRVAQRSGRGGTVY
ncbi:SDR family NAD(P)-dependent oxidoreductase, partial [Chloroflexota bacterium]